MRSKKTNIENVTLLLLYMFFFFYLMTKVLSNLLTWNMRVLHNLQLTQIYNTVNLLHEHVSSRKQHDYKTFKSKAKLKIKSTDLDRWPVDNISTETKEEEVWYTHHIVELCQFDDKIWCSSNTKTKVTCFHSEHLGLRHVAKSHSSSLFL